MNALSWLMMIGGVVTAFVALVCMCPASNPTQEVSLGTDQDERELGVEGHHGGAT